MTERKGNWTLPNARGSAAGRDRGTMKSTIANASKPVNPITLKKFSWEEDEKKNG